MIEATACADSVAWHNEEHSTFATTSFIVNSRGDVMSCEFDSNIFRVILFIVMCMQHAEFTKFVQIVRNNSKLFSNCRFIKGKGATEISFQRRIEDPELDHKIQDDVRDGERKYENYIQIVQFVLFRRYFLRKLYFLFL